MTGHRWNTRHGRSLAAVAALGLVVTVGCSRPDPNPPVRVTGDRDAAVPSTATTTEAPTTVAPSTTFFYGPNGPGEGGVVAPEPAAGADSGDSGVSPTTQATPTTVGSGSGSGSGTSSPTSAADGE